MANALPSHPDRSLKRWRTEDTSLFAKQKQAFPKYHVVHSNHETKTVRTMSPFLVSKSLTNAIGPGYKVTKMGSGDLLLEVRDKEQYDKLGHLVAFGSFPISVTAHRTMNTVKGVVSDEDLVELTEAELLDGWKDQDVVNVQRITIRRNDTEIPTKHLILTFNSTTLPETLETGYVKLHVRPYIPNPRRCFKCQRFGHASQSCRGQLTCPKCGTTGHSAEECTHDETHCANCDGDHPAYSRACPTWRKEKEIITLKVKENITFREARQRLSPSFAFKTSFAEVVRQGAAPQRPIAVARTTRSVPRQTPPAPKVGVAKAALPTSNMTTPNLTTPVVTTSSSTVEAKEGTSTSGAVGSKTSSPQTKSTRSRHQFLERASNAPQEAMDTSPSQTAQTAPKERRASLDRSKKDRTPITGPGKGPVK